MREGAWGPLTHMTDRTDYMQIVFVQKPTPRGRVIPASHVQANPCVNNSLPLMMTAPQSAHNSRQRHAASPAASRQALQPLPPETPEGLQATKPAPPARQKVRPAAPGSPASGPRAAGTAHRCCPPQTRTRPAGAGPRPRRCSGTAAAARRPRPTPARRPPCPPPAHRPAWTPPRRAARPARRLAQRLWAPVDRRMYQCHRVPQGLLL
jgi:hypothetical protein